MGRQEPCWAQINCSLQWHKPFSFKRKKHDYDWPFLVIPPFLTTLKDFSYKLPFSYIPGSTKSMSSRHSIARDLPSSDFSSMSFVSHSFHFLLEHRPRRNCTSSSQDLTTAMPDFQTLGITTAVQLTSLLPSLLLLVTVPSQILRRKPGALRAPPKLGFTVLPRIHLFYLPPL